MATKTLLECNTVGDAWRDVTGGLSRIVHVDGERIIVRRGRVSYSVYTPDWNIIATNVRSLETALSAQTA